MRKPRKRNVMLCYPYSDKRFYKWLGQVPHAYVQAKLNGTRLQWTGEVLVNSTGLIVQTLPHISRRLTKYFHDQPLDGEGYAHGMSLQDINSITTPNRGPNLHENYEAIQFHAFDIPIGNVTQTDRFSALYRKPTQKRMEKSGIARPVVWDTIKNKAQLITFLQDCMANKLEGTIVRHPNGLYKWSRSTEVMKWKPRMKDNYKIIFLNEGEGKYEGTLGSLTVSGEDGREFNVGSFELTDKQRAEMCQNN